MESIIAIIGIIILAILLRKVISFLFKVALTGTLLTVLISYIAPAVFK